MKIFGDYPGCKKKVTLNRIESLCAQILEAHPLYDESKHAFCKTEDDPDPKGFDLVICCVADDKRNQEFNDAGHPGGSDACRLESMCATIELGAGQPLSAPSASVMDYLESKIGYVMERLEEMTSQPVPPFKEQE